MKQDKKLQVEFIGRANRVIGDNSLRDYLSEKQETSRSPAIQKSKKLIKYKKPKNQVPSVLLIGSCITIPKYMQKRCIPPLGLSYLAGMLENHDIPVQMFDCCVEGWDYERIENNLVTYGLPPDNEKLFKILEEGNFDIIGLSVLFSTDLSNVLETANFVKSNFPEITVVIGGLHATIYPQDIFELDISQNNRSIDFVIRGEGEYRFLDFIKNFKEGFIDLNADGLVGYNKKKLFINPQVATIEALDEIPFPAFHLLPIEKYFAINIPFSPVPQGDRVLPMLTTRGCPVACSFCANTNVWRRHRQRSPENVVAEIESLKKKFSIDEIQFADDNLTFDMKSSVERFKKMTPLQILWCTPNGTMVNKLSPELIQVMTDSGMYQITLSIDSANTRTLKELHHKPVNLLSVPGLIEKSRELGVFTHGTLVVGMPGETIEEIEDGFQYVKDHLAFTSVSTFIASAIPGSELYQEMLDEGKITKEQARNIDTTRVSILQTDINPETLELSVEKFQTEFMEIMKNRDPEEYHRKYSKLINSGRWDQDQVGGKLT
jgi:anaerobic magnesium-protoporphyrin IX monomethyl ester cyclase